MINMEVVMAEEGRDAIGLLSLMIVLSECCNGFGCHGCWFTGLLPVVVQYEAAGGADQRAQSFFCNNIWKNNIGQIKYMYVIAHFHSDKVKCGSAYSSQ